MSLTGDGVVEYFQPPESFFSFWDVEEFLTTLEIIEKHMYLLLVSNHVDRTSEVNTRIIEEYTKVPKKSIILLLMEIPQKKMGVYEEIRREWRRHRGLVSRTLNGINIALRYDLRWGVSKELQRPESPYFIKALVKTE